MSIAIDLPPAMMQEAQGYASFAGTTLEQFAFDCLKAELQRKRLTGDALTRLDRLVARTGSRLTGSAYRFSRADAYEPEEVCA